MSSEPEKLNTSPERSAEALGETIDEQREQLRAKHEKAGELSPEDGERKAEKARVEALENAVSVEAGGAEKKRDSEPSSPAARRGRVTKKERDASYKRTMKQVQEEMSPAERTFSKVIHNKTVEKTSEVVGATVARPNAMLSGAIAAFVITLVVYTIAKTIGYQLSGFESIGSFVIGWIIGMLFDYLRVLVTGKR